VIRRGLISILALTLALLPAECAFGRAKSDLVRMTNGDRITGEIKGLTRGLLTMKTEFLGTLDVEWVHVAEVESSHLFILETADGKRHFGTITTSETEGVIMLADVDRVEQRAISLLTIVRLDQLENTFFDRLQGTLSAGLNYTRASDVLQYSLGAGVTYRSRRRSLSLEANSNLTSKRSEEVDATSQRHSLRFGYRELLQDRWFWTGLGEVSQNKDLGVALRTLAGGGGGRSLVQTHRSLLSVLGGIVVSREDVAGSNSVVESYEGLAGVDYQLFDVDSPETDFAMTLMLWPSLTEAGRVRADVQARLRRELIKDFFLELSFYNSYDSKPPSSEAAKNDWGFVTSAGYRF
jgi:Protein of unknown function, DUF481